MSTPDNNWCLCQHLRRLIKHLIQHVRNPWQLVGLSVVCSLICFLEEHFRNIVYSYFMGLKALKIFCLLSIKLSISCGGQTVKLGWRNLVSGIETTSSSRDVALISAHEQEVQLGWLLGEQLCLARCFISFIDIYLFEYLSNPQYFILCPFHIAWSNSIFSRLLLLASLCLTACLGGDIVLNFKTDFLVPLIFGRGYWLNKAKLIVRF